MVIAAVSSNNMIEHQFEAEPNMFLIFGNRDIGDRDNRSER